MEQTESLYVNKTNVHLETPDYRLFAKPYGPLYPEATGRIFRLEHHESSPSSVSYIKSIAPIIFDFKISEELPVKVYYEAMIDNERVLMVRIEYGQYERLIDLQKRNGNWLLLFLCTPRCLLSEGAKRAKLIMIMLDSEYAFREDMTAEERDALDVERQSFAMRMGWTQMSIPELEKQCKTLTDKLPY
ncbi:MAG: hypothetical protein AAB586_01350 [Patescibacteria group bacterium]